jgi:hypothetical protein
MKVYALVEAERDKLAGKSADTDAAAPGVSKAPDSVTFERHQKAVIDVATENLGLQNALVAEARQALADAKQKLDMAKEDEEDDANVTYNAALSDFHYAEYSAWTAERLLLKATGTKRGLAVATDDKLVVLVANLRRAEDAIDNLAKPLSDLRKASAANLEAWKAALADAEKRGDESEIRNCRLGYDHAISFAKGIEVRGAGL